MGMKVLVVEDDMDLCELVIIALEGAGYQTRGAGTIMEAANEIDNFKPDVVVTDYHLPDGTGCEVASMANNVSMRNRPRVIATSAEANQKERQKVLENGAECFIPKPYAITKLIEAIENPPELVVQSAVG